MNPQLLLDILWKRRWLRQHDRWSRERLLVHQNQGLQTLRDYAYTYSPFYQRFHKGLENRPLSELPVLTKATLMDHFDELVTDPAVKLGAVEAHLAQLKGDERFLNRYWVCATSGSTGRRGIFLYNQDEWTTVLASYARVYAWGGVQVGLTKRSRVAVVSTTTPFHQSARVGTTVQSPLVPTLRLDAASPLAHNVARLNAFQPEALVAYASMARLLAAEQLGGRLAIKPKAVFSASEVLTEEGRRLISEAWGTPPFNVYASTETATIASECEHHQGMHFYEDLVISEVVDEQYRPVQLGEYGDKVLVTVLFSRTQPLIRYEMSDSLRLTPAVCPSGRPYVMMDGVQGRSEEVLHLPATFGGKVAIHPNVLHDVMDLIPTAGWQVVLQTEGLRVLLVGADNPVVKDRVHGLLTTALGARRAVVPPMIVEWVKEIPKNPLGKTPLIKFEIKKGVN